METTDFFTDNIELNSQQEDNTLQQSQPEGQSILDVQNLPLFSDFNEFEEYEEVEEEPDAFEDYEIQSVQVEESPEALMQEAKEYLRVNGYITNGISDELTKALLQEDYDEKKGNGNQTVDMLNQSNEDHKQVIMRKLFVLSPNDRNAKDTHLRDEASDPVYRIIDELERAGLSREEILESTVERVKHGVAFEDETVARKIVLNAYDKLLSVNHDAVRDSSRFDESENRYRDGWAAKLSDVFEPYTYSKPVTKFNVVNGKLTCVCPDCGSTITLEDSPFVAVYFEDVIRVTQQAIKCNCGSRLHVSYPLMYNKLQKMAQESSNPRLRFPVICHSKETSEDFLIESSKQGASKWRIRHLDLKEAFENYRYEGINYSDNLDVVLQQIEDYGNVDVVSAILQNVYGICRILDSNFGTSEISPGYIMGVQSDIDFIDHIDSFDLVANDLQSVLDAFKCKDVDELKQHKPAPIQPLTIETFVNDLRSSWSFAAVVRPANMLQADIALKWLPGNMIDAVITCAKRATILQNADCLYSTEKYKAALAFKDIEVALQSLKRKSGTENIKRNYMHFIQMGQKPSSQSYLTVSSYADSVKPSCVPLYAALAIHECTYPIGEAREDYAVRVKQYLNIEAITKAANLVCKNYYSEIAPTLHAICENEFYDAYNVPDYLAGISLVTDILVEEKIDEETYGYSNPKFVAEELKLQTGEIW